MSSNFALYMKQFVPISFVVGASMELFMIKTMLDWSDSRCFTSIPYRERHVEPWLGRIWHTYLAERRQRNVKTPFMGFYDVALRKESERRAEAEAEYQARRARSEARRRARKNAAAGPEEDRAP